MRWKEKAGVFYSNVIRKMEKHFNMNNTLQLHPFIHGKHIEMLPHHMPDLSTLSLFLQMAMK